MSIKNSTLIGSNDEVLLSQRSILTRLSSESVGGRTIYIHAYAQVAATRPGDTGSRQNRISNPPKLDSPGVRAGERVASNGTVGRC